MTGLEPCTAEELSAKQRLSIIREMVKRGDDSSPTKPAWFEYEQIIKDDALFIECQAARIDELESRITGLQAGAQILIDMNADLRAQLDDATCESQTKE